MKQKNSQQIKPLKDDETQSRYLVYAGKKDKTADKEIIEEDFTETFTKEYMEEEIQKALSLQKEEFEKMIKERIDMIGSAWENYNAVEVLQELLTKIKEIK